MSTLPCRHFNLPPSALELERDKTGIPVIVGGMSGEGSNIGTVLTRSAQLAGMLVNVHILPGSTFIIIAMLQYYGCGCVVVKS